ncbi:uncharacterized protein inaF-D isoform X1 [Venturia canescens]|uniref:uncharacterized protein inaF-D isoform X1 n=1 Tax=Venturia canescens TaxID=32260 RepID=UPI001C9CC1C4|nr:uncharacterized protein LOC122409229 isoform X1 [Venturia canescens]
MLAQGADNGGDGAGGPDKAKTDALYENRPTHKKIIRVITVMAYMVSVSFVAIVLSGYYVFLWQPPNPRLLHRAHLRADPQIEYRVEDGPISRSIELADRVDLRQEILRNRGIKISDGIDANAESRDLGKSVPRRNKTVSKDTRIFSATWRPIFQASLGTRASANADETRLSPVYKSVNNVPINRTDFATNEFSRNLSTTESATVRLEGNESSESLTEEAINASTLNPILKDVSKPDVDSDGDNSTKDPLERRSTRILDINDRRIIVAEARQALENYEVSNAMNSTSGSKTFNLFPGYRTTEKMENGLKTQSVVRPNELGSHIARVAPTRAATNDSLDDQKHEKNLPGQPPSRDSLVDSSTEDIDTVNELALESSPLIVQPELKFSDEDKVETKEERVSQEIDDFNLLSL